jgi:hypothetical protein
LEAGSALSGEAPKVSEIPDFVVACKTCGVTKRCHTTQGVNAFTFEHAGHEVVRGAEALAIQAVSAGRSGGAEEKAAGPTLDESVPLLLAGSSYIEQDEAHLHEARRVSAALEEFRWNAHPPYVVGVLFRDILSVESATGLIGKNLIRKIQELGYNFVTITASHSTPTAWFKKKQRAETVSPGALLQGVDGSPVHEGISGSDPKEAELWDEAFLSLLTAVKDLDSSGLSRAARVVSRLSKGSLKQGK